MLNGFSEACYNQNSIEELIAIGILIRTYDFFDKTDCNEWGISKDEYQAAILEVLRIKEKEYNQ